MADKRFQELLELYDEPFPHIIGPFNLGGDFPATYRFQKSDGFISKLTLSPTRNGPEYERLMTNSVSWSGIHKLMNEKWYLRLFERIFDVKLTKGWLEFSMMCLGDHSAPHRDNKDKKVSIICPMTYSATGTDILVPKVSGLQDYVEDYDKFSIFKTFEYKPGMALMFKVSDHSWHGVRQVKDRRWGVNIFLA